MAATRSRSSAAGLILPLRKRADSLFGDDPAAAAGKRARVSCSDLTVTNLSRTQPTPLPFQVPRVIDATRRKKALSAPART